MTRFFQVIKELPTNQNHWTAVGIDRKLQGYKAVMQDDKILYQTRELTTEVQQLLKTQPQPGLLTTEFGRMYVETLGSKKKIILCGGGHVSAATLSVAKMMEFHITVLEDRPEFAQAARVAGADEVICNNFTDGLRQLDTDGDTYVIIMTRGHRHDLECLHQMLHKNYAYLGMMGSRSRVKKIKEQLTEEGFDLDKIEGLHAPIGLSIGAATPAEIAVSIMAEVIAEKNQRKRQEAYEKELAAWLFRDEKDIQELCTSHQRVVLATIIDRKGSAPRQVGTKMLVFADGSSLGTIGGGCMEAEVKNKARHMLAVWQETGDRKKCYSTCFVDMTGRDAEEEGMVCGGTLEIYLEIL